MSAMPKMIDSELKARAVHLVNEHLGEYPSLTAAASAVAKQLGEIKALKPKVRRVEEEDAVQIRRILDLGHDIGLHYDAALFERLNVDPLETCKAQIADL